MTLRQLHSSYTILLAFLKIIKGFNFITLLEIYGIHQSLIRIKFMEPHTASVNHADLKCKFTDPASAERASVFLPRFAICIDHTIHKALWVTDTSVQ